MAHVVIRRERVEDRRAVEALVRDSFFNVYRPGCTEHYVLKCLRRAPAFVQELDLVMERDRVLMGQVAFVRADIVTDDGGTVPVLTLGPICIAPKWKRQGYGSQLLAEALRQAKELGYGAVLLEGNIRFYGKCGFTYARDYGIRYHGLPEGEDDSFFLCKELTAGSLAGVPGEYATPAGYFACEQDPEAFAAYEATFPYRERLRLPGQLFEG